MRRVTCDDVETSTRRDGAVRRCDGATMRRDVLRRAAVRDRVCMYSAVLYFTVHRGTRVLLNGAGRAGRQTLPPSVIVIAHKLPGDER